MLISLTSKAGQAFSRPSRKVQATANPKSSPYLGNSTDTLAKRGPYEEYGQFGVAVRRAVVGAIGGAAGGAITGSGWMIPTALGTSFATWLAMGGIRALTDKSGFPTVKIFESSLTSLYIGLGAGLGGYALSALGVPPALAGAVAGAVTGLSLDKMVEKTL